MKKISFIFLMMALILCFSACGKKADPIALPSADKITSIEVAGGVADIIVTDKEAIAAIIEKVSEAQDTTQEVEIYFNFVGKYVHPTLESLLLFPMMKNEGCFKTKLVKNN